MILWSLFLKARGLKYHIRMGLKEGTHKSHNNIHKFENNTKKDTSQNNGWEAGTSYYYSSLYYTINTMHNAQNIKRFFSFKTKYNVQCTYIIYIHNNQEIDNQYLILILKLCKWK